MAVVNSQKGSDGWSGSGVGLDFIPARKLENHVRFVFFSGPVSSESNKGIELLISRLFRRYVKETVSFEDFNLSDDDFPMGRKTVLIFPGAMSCESWKFSESQIAVIKKYARSNLLKIYGVCAGAYFCSQRSVYKSEERGETLDCKRELDLFKGTFAGPVFPDNEAFSGKVNIKLAKVRADLECIKGMDITTETFTDDVIMNGGGCFLPGIGSDCKVIAQFEDTDLQEENRDIAMVACNIVAFGSGPIYSTFLSSCHVEHSTACLETFLEGTSDVKRYQSLLGALSTSRNMHFRMNLFYKGFKALGLS